MLRISRKCLVMFVSLIAVAFLAGCNTAPRTSEGKADIIAECNAALRLAHSTDSSLDGVLRKAAGYAVFPSVGKGAIGVGGAYGKGVLYQMGQPIGYCDLSQGTIGLQFGGQSYCQIIAFETQQAVTEFKEGKFRFAAQATAVALKSGAGTNAKYTDNVAVFTMDEAGLMYEASIGGQKFSYQPM